MPRLIPTLVPALLMALLAALAAVLPAPPVAHAAEPAAEPVVIADGHVDLGPRLVDGNWVLRLRDDTEGEPVWRDPADVVLQVVDAAGNTVPDDPAYAFLGAPGSAIWVLPQVQAPGVVWPGWNTQDPGVVDTAGRGVDWRLHGVRGPGRFELFLNGDFGAPVTLFSSERPYPQETAVEPGTHAHGNWVFTAPGAYLLDVEMAAADGRADRATLRVHVGPGDPVAAFAEVERRATTPPTTAARPADGTAEDPPGPPWGLLATAAALVAGVLASLLAVRSRRRARRNGDD
ncbi:choice-of-anchor M domain-containing protein [Saccharothrix sp. BKS2]|uniref:choice-of-anchor M domain-containing protein n=1 Tax=Saccharothrix sp. BKS2 TaxID=3064400 RepID=UPI0039ED4C13